MAKPVVAVLEGEFPVFGLERISNRAEIRVVSAGGLAGAIPGADVLFLWDFFSLEVAEVLRRPHDLQWIHVSATGVDKLLVPELVESSVVLTNAHGVFDRPIAEYVLTCIGALMKQLPLSFQLQGLRQWNTRETRNLFGLEVLIVGAGGIGRATARLLSDVGMKVELMGMRERVDPEFGLIHSSSDLADRVGTVDVVVMATPLTDGTKNLLSESVIDAFRPGSYLVNVGRGLTVDQQALIRALADGRIAGAALDTFQFEPLPIDDQLWRLPNVFVSPHMSSRTEGWLEALITQFCVNFQAWQSGGTMSGVVDKRLGFVR